MKKKVIIILILAVIGALSLKKYITDRTGDEKFLLYDKKDINMINNVHPTEILVYGDDVLFDEGLSYRKIDKLSEETLTSSRNYECTFLIINDTKRDSLLFDKDFTLCEKMCENGKFNFAYVGERYIEHLAKRWFDDRILIDEIRGLAYTNTPHGYEFCRGFWTTDDENNYKDNQYLLGSAMVNLIMNIIK